jgi:predicted nucleotidyltransferase
VFSHYPKIEKAILYGSRAKGTYKKGSDIDIALVGKNLNIKELNQIWIELDDLMLPYQFDLTLYNILSNDEFIDHIDRVGIEIYSKNQ